jgi:hypothetical protein
MTAALSVLLLASILWGNRQRVGRRTAEQAAAYNLRRMRHCRKQCRAMMKQLHQPDQP